MIDDVWQELTAYESRDVVESVYQRKHGRQPNAARIQDITANFVQAREYFHNAANSAITVRPLLQYYGVLGLARGVILMQSSNKGAEALKPSHGLEPKGWASTLSNGIKDFGKITVAIRSGTFSELLNATQNTSYLKHNTSGVNWKMAFVPPTNGDEFTFFDIVSRIVDAVAEFRSWANETPPIAQLGAISPNAESKTITMKLTNTNQESVDQLFKGDKFKKTINGKNADIEMPNRTHVAFSQKYRGTLGIGEVFVVTPTFGSAHLNTLGQYFAASYFLGMMVRYFPATWITLGRQIRGDGVFPLIRRLMDLIQQSYPLIVLDFLSSPHPFETK